MQMDRRTMLKLGLAAGVSAWLPDRLWADPATTAAVHRLPMVRFPEKTNMLLQTDRPPQLEMPLKYFQQDITPNNVFFVRWHLSGIPTTVDLKTFRLVIDGHVDQPLSLSVDDLKSQFEPVSMVAVGQCSGNSRSFFEPRVPGGQWGNGAVGNAKWTGVRLSDLLKKAAMKAGAVQMSFAGLDDPPLPDTAKFVKSLDVDHAADGEVMVAYAMNDAPLPMLNGFPLRLIVPGWYATYWVKSLTHVNVLNDKYHGFWMDKAYRIPTTPDAIESPTDLAKVTVPINRHSVRSLFALPMPGQNIPAGKPFEVQGVALDAGDGIAKVELSTDGGATWTAAKLDPSLGKYSWRRWRYDWTPAAGKYELAVKATNAKGETQVTSQWNRSGYMRNVIERMSVTVA